MQWNPLASEHKVTEIINRSHEVPCLIFKHSTRCEISAIAKYRLESDWDFASNQLEPYYLDLLSYRAVSAHIADAFQVHHESPQVLLIQGGECIYDASHLDISIAELHEAMNAIAA